MSRNPVPFVETNILNTHGLDALILLLACPFLIFPTVLSAGTILALVLLLLFLVRNWGRVPVSPMNLSMLVWAVMLAIGTLVTADPQLTVPKCTGLLLGISVWLFMARFDNGWANRWSYLLIGGGFIAFGVVSTDWPSKVPALEGIVARLAAFQIHLPESPVEGVQANQLAAVLLMVLFPLIGMVQAYNEKWPLKISLGLGALLVAFLLVLTQSRSAWLATIVASGFVLLANWYFSPPSIWRSRLGKLWLVVTAFGLIVVSVNLVPRLNDLVAEPAAETPIGDFASVEFRAEVWRWGVRAIGEFPLTGMGLGSFREASRRLYPMNVVPTVDIAHAHNVFLQVALDAGIPGLIAYIAILINVLGMGWAVASRFPRRRAWHIGLLAAIVSLHVYGLADALAPGAKPGLLYWWVLGAITASYRTTQDQS